MSSAKRAKHQERLRRLKWDMEERQTPAEEPAQSAITRREQERTDLIEQRIQEAMANGEFDNLPGRGKPLPVHTNPYLDPTQELAFGLLQNNGMVPEWIERDKEIRQELEAARERLRLAWQQYQVNLSGEATWQAAMTRFEEALVKLNRKIDHFNLIVPIASNQRFRLRLDEELRRVREL
ncbi:MAG TPA: DnaJ family domain-containing protein [Anaerolineae bacterium]|nr:DnaJ family domain-containing protein [Anaerolineae bacterium]